MGESLHLEATAAGVLIPVQARAGASRDAIVGIHEGRLKVSVTQAPEKGKANRAIIALLARELKLKRSQITLVSGQTSNQKLLRAEGVSLADLQTRAAECLKRHSGQ